MPTVTAASLLTKVETLLQDSANVRWSQPELLGWLNDSQRAICALRPDACMKLTTVNTAVGTKQSVPYDANGVVKIVRNMGVDGTVPGAPIRQATIEMLDALVPTWHTMTPTSAAQHYIYDPIAPKSFYLYPPSTGTYKVEMLYPSSPVDMPSFTEVATYAQGGTVVTVTLAAHNYSVGGWLKFTPTSGSAVPGVYQVTTVPATNTFTFTTLTSLATSGGATVEAVTSVDDTFSNAMIDYSMYRAYLKDNDLLANNERAQGHFVAFNAGVAGKTQADNALSAAKVE